MVEPGSACETRGIRDRVLSWVLSSDLANSDNDLVPTERAVAIGR
jgi:hypothetical protein